jgi:hypothetical protein
LNQLKAHTKILELFTHSMPKLLQNLLKTQYHLHQSSGRQFFGIQKTIASKKHRR